MVQYSHNQECNFIITRALISFFNQTEKENDSTTGIVTAMHGLAISNWQHANITVFYLRKTPEGKQWS